MIPTMGPEKNVCFELGALGVAEADSDIFGDRNRIAVVDPVYPVYVDSNVMAGHTGSADDSGTYEGLVYLPCTKSNGFVPEVVSSRVDLIYLCFPNMIFEMFILLLSKIDFAGVVQV